MVGVSGVSSTLLAGCASGCDGRGHGDLGRLGVGGVFAVVTVNEGVLAGGCRSDELLRCRTTHRPGEREHDPVVEPEAGEDPLVRVAVRAVCRGQPVVGHVEGVRVLHGELAPPQDPCTWARLVAVLRLDLEQDQRVVPVRRVLAPDQQAEQPPVGGAEQGRKLHLLPADRRYLLANDPLDVAHDSDAERQPGVAARPHPADVAGAHEQLVARNIGVRRVVAQRAQEQRRQSHQHDSTVIALHYSDSTGRLTRVRYAS